MYRSLLPVLLALLLCLPEVAAQDAAPRVVAASRVNTSLPLRDLPIQPAQTRTALPAVVPNKFHSFDKPSRNPNADRPGFTDPVLDAGRSTAGPGTVLESFDGVSAAESFLIPPDTNGDVGLDHYVHWINGTAKFYDKAGNVVLGPVPGNFFWQGLGGPCDSRNDGDPIILYDELAGRWVAMQFMLQEVVTGFGTNALCIAVSTTSDPTGSYHQYQFNNPYFPDYPKIGVWPDAYYMTTRSFGAPGGFRMEAMAFERARMLNGQQADMVSFFIPRNNNGTDIDGFLPADLDGPPPPAGTPGLFVGGPVTSPQQLRIYGLDVNWTNPNASTFSLLNTLTPAGYDSNVSGGIPQPSPGASLEVLSFTLMHRVQYRNFGDRQTLVLNHTVDAGGNRAGVRWYELRNGAGNTGSGWSLYQQGTYAPNDGLDRWMASAALNGNGDLAIGYSVSGPSLFPSIRFTGQTAAMSGTGTLDVAETTILTGGGAQTGVFSGRSRWGDYSMLSVDPANDESFWFTTEYYQTTSFSDFRTRIAEFVLPSGGDLTVTITPNTPPAPVVLQRGDFAFFDVTFEVSADGPSSFEFWTEVDLPNGSTRSPLIGPSTINVSPPATVTQTFVQRVPNQAPFGSYAYRAEVGSFPNDVADADAFSAEIVPGRADGPDDWQSFDAEGRLLEGGQVYDFRTAPGTDTPAASSEALPVEAALAAAYPNPFAAATTLGFALPAATDVTLEVLDVLGRRVALVAQGEYEAGTHTASFDASGLASGAYLVRLTTGGGFAEVQRVTLLR
ncbi:MAG: T9SS type A sorting domain-containing protein [Bacteroidota bacterium]